MRKNQKRQNYEGKFVQLHYFLLNSAAWKSLSLKAIFVYIELKKKYNGRNDNDLSLTYKELKSKLSPASISKAFKELEDTGFIKVVKNGGLYRGCNIYGFSKRWELFVPKSEASKTKSTSKSEATSYETDDDILKEFFGDDNK